MADFEIRYFRADGTLAIVHITACDTQAEAEERARTHQYDHARFEILQITPAG